LMTIYGFLNFKAPWKRAVMMLVALPFAIMGNVVRLCFTIAVAESFGQKAGKAVETDAGYITFAVAIFCAYLVARWLEKGEGQNRAADKSTEEQALISGKKSMEQPTLADKPATP